MSNVPSKTRPHSSPFALSVAEPELPPVMSTVERKFTGTSPSFGSTYGVSSRPSRRDGVELFFGARTRRCPSPFRRRSRASSAGVHEPVAGGDAEDAPVRHAQRRFARARRDRRFLEDGLRMARAEPRESALARLRGVALRLEGRVSDRRDADSSARSPVATEPASSRRFETAHRLSWARKPRQGDAPIAVRDGCDRGPSRGSE